MNLVRVTEGGGWVCDPFHDPNKSLTVITLVSNPSRQENKQEEPNLAPKPLGMTKADSDIV